MKTQRFTICFILLLLVAAGARLRIEQLRAGERVLVRTAGARAERGGPDCERENGCAAHDPLRYPGTQNMKTALSVDSFAVRVTCQTPAMKK